MKLQISVTLEDDGTVTVDGYEAAEEWCRLHEKGLAIALWDAGAPEPDHIVAAGDQAGRPRLGVTA